MPDSTIGVLFCGIETCAVIVNEFKAPYVGNKIF